MEGAMLYRKFPAYNLNVSSAIPSDNLVRSMRSFTIPITTNFGLFSQMLKVTLETFLMRRDQPSQRKPELSWPSHTGKSSFQSLPLSSK